MKATAITGTEIAIYKSKQKREICHILFDMVAKLRLLQLAGRTYWLLHFSQLQVKQGIWVYLLLASYFKQSLLLCRFADPSQFNAGFSAAFLQYSLRFELFAFQDGDLNTRCNASEVVTRDLHTVRGQTTSLAGYPSLPYPSYLPRVNSTIDTRFDYLMGIHCLVMYFFVMAMNVREVTPPSLSVTRASFPFKSISLNYTPKEVGRSRNAERKHPGNFWNQHSQETPFPIFWSFKFIQKLEVTVFVFQANK